MEWGPWCEPPDDASLRTVAGSLWDLINPDRQQLGALVSVPLPRGIDGRKVLKNTKKSFQQSKATLPA